MKQLAEQSPAMQKTVNVDIWFDRLAFNGAGAVWDRFRWNNRTRLSDSAFRK
jgi:hypothetical protein